MNWCIVVLKDTVVLWEMASNHWPQIVFQYVNVFQSVYSTFNKVQSTYDSVKCNASPNHYTKSLPWRWRGAASLEVERCRLVAILRQLFSICTPCYPAQFLP